MWRIILLIKIMAALFFAFVILTLISCMIISGQCSRYEEQERNRKDGFNPGIAIIDETPEVEIEEGG